MAKRCHRESRAGISPATIRPLPPHWPKKPHVLTHTMKKRPEKSALLCKEAENGRKCPIRVIASPICGQKEFPEEAVSKSRTRAARPKAERPPHVPPPMRRYRIARPSSPATSSKRTLASVWVPISRRVTTPSANSSGPSTATRAAPSLSASLNWLFKLRF